MAAPDQKVTALLTEHLTYTPLTFIDDVINSANRLLYGVCADVETYLNTSRPSALGFFPPEGGIAETDDDGNEMFDEEATDELANGVHQLEMLMENGVDRGFDGFELFALRNIFSIPDDVRDWVRLKHHKGIDFSQPSQSDQPLPTISSVSKLRQQLHEKAAEQRSLREEVAKNKAIISALKAAIDPTPSAQAAGDAAKSNAHPFEFLLSPSRAMQKLNNIPESTAFAVEQVRTLRNMMKKLQETSVSVLKENGHDSDGRKMDVDAPGLKSEEEERAFYVEKMSRRHLEKARGLPLTSEGSLKSGEGELIGDRKNETDAATLENLAVIISNTENS